MFVELRRRELSSDELSDKCLHGETQNTNEADQNIWNKLPKNVFVGRRVLEMGVNSALIEFNDGSQQARESKRCCKLSEPKMSQSQEKKPFCGMRKGWNIDRRKSHPIQGKKEEKQ